MDGISLRTKMPDETTTMTEVKSLEQHSLVRYGTGSEPTRRFTVRNHGDGDGHNERKKVFHGRVTVLADEVSFLGIGPISLTSCD